MKPTLFNEALTDLISKRQSLLYKKVSVLGKDVYEIHTSSGNSIDEMMENLTREFTLIQNIYLEIQELQKEIK